MASKQGYDGQLAAADVTEAASSQKTAGNGAENEAIDIPTETDAIEQAQPQRDNTEGKAPFERTEYIAIGVMVVAVLAIILALGLVFGLRKENTTVYMTRAPTSSAPSNSPSAAPSGVLDPFLDNLPAYSLESLQVAASPQSKALYWLLDHQKVSQMTTLRQVQVFALATFYYAFEGPRWPDLIRNDWLDDTKSECDWFSSVYGQFDGVEDEPAQPAPCNAKGEFQSLSLDSLNLNASSPLLPPELALLTSLSEIALADNGVSASLSDMVSRQLFIQLTNLHELNLASNYLTGPIPSEIGFLTSLTRLGLNDNRLSGPIPSELGQLTLLEHLDLSANSLSGPVPSEIGALPNLVTFDGGVDMTP